MYIGNIAVSSVNLVVQLHIVASSSQGEAINSWAHHTHKHLSWPIQDRKLYPISRIHQLSLRPYITPIRCFTKQKLTERPNRPLFWSSVTRFMVWSSKVYQPCFWYEMGTSSRLVIYRDAGHHTWDSLNLLPKYQHLMCYMCQKLSIFLLNPLWIYQ